MRPNEKDAIKRHYDVASPYYRKLWGEHVHHGYWIRGDETKERAQIQLIEHLATAARIKAGRKILDVGCGLGGSSVFLAKNYHARVTGITISPVQVEMAKTAAAAESADAKFLLMDAQDMHFQELFDVVWSVESIAHYQDKGAFFSGAAKLLVPGGAIAIVDWFKKDNLIDSEVKKFIRPIEHGMFVELETMDTYLKFMKANHLEIIKTEVLNEKCAKTWDIASEVIKLKDLWALAVKNGADFVRFLKAFRAMRAGFASGTFVYGLIVARRV